MNRDMVVKAEQFLLSTFSESVYLQNNPAELDYRLEHSYRVANIAKNIALSEGLDVTGAVLAGLLHDIAYCEEMKTRDNHLNHGRRSAAIARPFLDTLELPPEVVNEICYGIAIHVDDCSDFEGVKTALCETVSDADNIDRFDAYRIYETLQFQKFSTMNLEEKKEKASATLARLSQLKEMPLGTQTAKQLWLERLEYYIGFYERLMSQLENSSAVI